MNTQVLGISTDPIPSLSAWAEDLGGISYPLLSDFWPHGEVSQQFGVFREEGYAERAIFILDRQGVIRHLNIYDIDTLPENEEIFKELAKLEPEAARKQEPVEAVQLPSGGIVMYCTKWCHSCRKARAWLQEHDLEYTEVDIYEVPGAKQQIKDWAGGPLITPTFDIDGTIVHDYDVERLEELLLNSPSG